MSQFIATQLKCFSLFIVLTSHCFGQYSDEFLKITEYETCTTLIDSVKHNWAFNKKKNYYYSQFTPSELTTKWINFPCIRGIKKEDIKVLFGQPNVIIGKRLWKYYTAPPHKNGFANSYLSIHFNIYDRIDKISERNQKGVLKRQKKNWKQNWRYIDTLGYYQFIKHKDITHLGQVFFKTDAIKIKRKFGEPSIIISENEWQYHFSNSYRDNKYAGNGIKLLFRNGKLENIRWVYSVPLISPSH